MRLILTILFFWAYAANATNYYISNSGSDSNDGLTTATAWQTISKVNASTFNAGDSILLKRGDSWNERLIPPSNGIYIGAYGTGATPTITGLKTITGFTNIGGNIWTATVSASAALNMVLINGQVAHKGRYPNSTYLNYISKAFSSLTTSLTGTPNYTGAIAVVRTASWIWDLSTITSQSGGVLNLSPNLTYSQDLQTHWFFLQGMASFVDTLNEYDYTGTTLTVYSSTTPTVQVSTIDTLVWLVKKSNITFDGLSITGANKAAIQFDTSTIITVQNCSFNYSGTIALSALKTSRLSILNNTINNSLSGAIYARQLDLVPADYSNIINQCDSAIVIGNTIKNTGVFQGMAMGGNGRSMAIYIQGLNLGPYIANNNIDSTGNTVILYHGKKSVARNNIVSNFCFVKDDGGGIGSGIGSYLPLDYDDSATIASNIVYNGIGVAEGALKAQAHGIYLDVYSRLSTIDSNTVFNCSAAGLAIDGRKITIRNNNLFNNAKNIWLSAYAGTIDSNYITRNAFYNSNSVYLIDAFTLVSPFGFIDSNFYYNPYNTVVKYSNTNYSLAGWQYSSAQDLNSKGLPKFLLSTTPTLFYNPTFSDSTIYFSGRKISLRGVTYAGSITLHPFQSAILFDAIVPHSYKFQALK
jgi:parallel beta-helix repeat protein